MEVHVDVGAKTVVLDRQGRWCADLAPPDNWCAFYHWTDMGKGIKEPYPQSGHGFDWFDDPAEMQWAVEAWQAAAPPETPSLAGEPPPEPEPPLPMPPQPEPRPAGSAEGVDLP